MGPHLACSSGASGSQAADSARPTPGRSTGSLQHEESSMKGTEQRLKGPSPMSILHETGLWARKRGPRGCAQESTPRSEAQPGDCLGPRAGPWPSARIPHTVHIRCTPHAPTAPSAHVGQTAGEQADGDWQPPGSPRAQPLTFLALFPHTLKHRFKNPEPQQTTDDKAVSSRRGTHALNPRRGTGAVSWR